MSNATVLVRALFRALSLAGLAFALACGGDEPKVERQKDDGPPKKKEEAAGPEVEYVQNPAWTSIKGFFQGHDNDPSGGFVRNGVQTLRDPFETQVMKYVPAVEPPPPYERDPLAEEAKPDEVSDGGEPDVPQIEPAGPLEKFRAQDYRLLLIHWGTSANKAVVMDPEGESYIVKRDQVIGNRKGRIIDITRYDVVIQEDTSPEPIVLSIQADLLKPQPDERTTDRLFINTGGAK